METSVFLAKIVGPYCIIGFAAGMANRKNLPRLMQEYADNVALTQLGGLLATVVGLLIVVSHNVWVADWRAIITVAGWLGLIKGIVLVIAPAAIGRYVGMTFSPMMTVMFVVVLGVGLYLSYVGYLLPAT